MNGRATQPPTNWTFILASVGGFLLLGFIFLKTFWFPWQQSKRELERAEEDYDKLSREYKTFLKEKKRLDIGQLQGMPRELESGSNEYAKYLQNLLQDYCGFTGVRITPSGHEAKPKSQNVGGAKKPDHIVLSFQVQARGDWPSFVKLLEKFQKTPLLHRLRNLTIDRQSGQKKDSAKLTFAMNIETMVVQAQKNKQRPDNLWGIDPRLQALDSALTLYGQPAGWALILRGQALLFPEMPGRKYTQLAWVNPFLGGKPKSPDDQKSIVAKKEKKKPPVRSDFRLVLTNPSDQRALLLAKVGADKNTVVNLDGPLDVGVAVVTGTACASTRMDAFTVFDGIDTIKGKVLRVDLREVYVRVGSEVYGIGFEKTLAECLKRPLSAEELRKVGLSTEP